MGARFLKGIVVCLMVAGMAGCMGPKPVDNMAEMQVEFDFVGGGCQLSSPNPELHVVNVPEGTSFLKVRMTDLDMTSYNHGGGTVPYSGKGFVEAGALKAYQGPCPPSGTSHKYVFDVQALNADQTLMLGRGKAAKKFSQ
ncbi:MAG: YbhB/YbcL family Raf kinase inhibitor-like protein [Halodesulfovibrio sp.]